MAQLIALAQGITGRSNTGSEICGTWNKKEYRKPDAGEASVPIPVAKHETNKLSHPIRPVVSNITIVQVDAERLFS